MPNVDLNSIAEFADDVLEVCDDSCLRNALTAIRQAAHDHSDEPLEAFALIHMNLGQS